jgi:hypothetical protein
MGRGRIKNRPGPRKLSIQFVPCTLGVEVTITESLKAGERGAEHSEKDKRKDGPATPSAAIESVTMALGEFMDRVNKEAAKDDSLPFGKPAEGEDPAATNTGAASPSDPPGKFQKPKRSKKAKAKKEAAA